MNKFLISSIIVLLAIIHTTAQSSVTFLVKDLPTETAKNIGIRGNTPPLSWDTSIALEATAAGYTKTIEFAENTAKIEFKFVQYNEDSQPIWETNENRVLTLIPDSTLLSESSWDKEPIYDISTLELLTPDELLADYELIKTMVLEVHPGTYRYNDQSSIDSALTELQSKLSQSLSHGAAYLAMSKLIAQLQCDHTQVGMNNQGNIINSIIHYQKDKLPFTFKWLDAEMIVLQNASNNNQLKKGTAIKKINGVLVENIQKEMMPYIPADGATDGNRCYKMQVNGYDFRYNGFDVLYPLLFPLVSDSLVLEIQQYGEELIETIQVSYLTRAARSEMLANRHPSFPTTRDELWDFKLLNENTGLLTLNSFGLSGWKAMTLDYKQFLADAFSTLNKEKVANLIIDIRENTGGSDEMAAELFRYLIKEPFQFETEGRTRYTIFPESLKPYIQTWGDNPWYFQLKPKAPKTADGYYIFKENFKTKAKKSNKTIYKGKLYLLTSAANTSLAYYVANTFKHQQLGISIGQETGGNLNDINGGQILFLRLPNSNIEIDFPVMGGFTTQKQPNTGVIPTIHTMLTRKDIIMAKDVELERALKLIGNK